MSDDIVRQLSKYGDYDEETSWESFRVGYLLKSPEQRRADLATMDQWLATQSGITREHASMLTRKRELEDNHWELRRAGR